MIALSGCTLRQCLECHTALTISPRWLGITTRSVCVRAGASDKENELLHELSPYTWRAGPTSGAFFCKPCDAVVCQNTDMTRRYEGRPSRKTIVRSKTAITRNVGPYPSPRNVVADFIVPCVVAHRSVSLPVNAGSGCPGAVALSRPDRQQWPCGRHPSLATYAVIFVLLLLSLPLGQGSSCV
jgi:hypothetical protein